MNRRYSSWTLSNLSRLLLLLLLLLLLFNCDCGCRMTDEHQQQNYTVTTKTQKTKRWIYIHIMCNFQLRRQIPVRHIMLRCSPIEASGGQEEHYIRSSWLWVMGCSLGQADIQSDLPPIEASTSHEQYYIRLTWHFTECNWEGSWEPEVPPNRGIWWPRAVLSWKVLSV